MNRSTSGWGFERPRSTGRVYSEYHGIELAAIALVLPWNYPQETEQERIEADRVIALLQRFPGALLCTVQEPTSREDLTQRRQNLVGNVNAVSRRASRSRR